ncbi:hypothetical protein DFH08DRAFT_1035165, partial [Mycena albidolilacea]
ADFKLHPDSDDVLLFNVVMSHLEHADDMAIVSYTPEGLQHHLNTFTHWCGDNFLQANTQKSWVMVFGPLPKDAPIFTLNGRVVGYKDHFCYVGVTFQSTARNIFSAHYTAKASTARKTGHSVLGIEAYIGDIPPKEGRLLYMACIDPHLISGADMIVDVDDAALALLEKVQTMFLRWLLGLGPNSMHALLFTELGLLPIQYRRLILALRYLGYLVYGSLHLAALPPTHYVHLALEDSYSLYKAGGQGYWMDLVYALGKLPNPVVLPALPALTPNACTVLGKAVYISAMKYLEGEILNSMCLYLLHGRKEPLKDEAPKRITIFLRHYLTLVINNAHRRVLTRLLLSQHPLAVERMRYKSRYHRVDILREQRLCRFGCHQVETVEHAMLQCTAKPELEERRHQFVVKVAATEPRLHAVTPGNATAVLRALIFRRDTVCQVVKFAHQVFQLFDNTPMVWP